MPARDGWTFLTNHGYVLMTIADDPEIRLRDIAAAVGITERAAQHIVSDLNEAGYITIHKVGRRNRYSVHADTPMRHPSMENVAVKKLLKLLSGFTNPAK